MSDNVKVAVRVRPFNEREEKRGASNVVHMSGNKTELKMEGKDPRSFTFDHSYWSHDGFKKRDDEYLEPDSSSSKYADQQKVFDDLGQGVIDNAWQGYNCSLFAYGQTGSGKSYSVVGYNKNKGLIPMFCDKLFRGIEDKRNTSGNEDVYTVTFSMLEIYNEQVRDLLNKKGLKEKGHLKLKQNPKSGFTVHGLQHEQVSSYSEVDRKTNEGFQNRTVASTNMNATSSRAHTIVAITFTQQTPDKAVKSMRKSSVVNLVDLAGSEKVGQTGAEGHRLKEGAQINMSLSSLGNVINALAKGAGHVPFRDSVLTKLLMNALGGNSKTVMIAALSPADINYEETLSTLRFADRAKSVKTKAVVNEDPTDKLIRELREENARLMKLLTEGGLSSEIGPGETNKEKERRKDALEAELKQNKEELENMKKSSKEMAETFKDNAAKLEEEKKLEGKKQSTPHFWNLNEDLALTKMLFHFCEKDKCMVGNPESNPPADILLPGLNIQAKHAVVTRKGKSIFLEPQTDSKLRVNGKKLDSPTELHHNDRVQFGANTLYVFFHPEEAKRFKDMKQPDPTFASAQEEIAETAGLVNYKKGGSNEDGILMDDVVEMMQIVNEANAMSEFLDKKVKFEVALVSPMSAGQAHGLTEVKMRMKDLNNGNEWLISKQAAETRKILMQDMYQNRISNDNWEVAKEQDPFWEPPETDILIGTAHVHLMTLAHQMAVEDDQLEINDYRAQCKAKLAVQIKPCDDKFKPLGDDKIIEDPQQMLGKDFYFIVNIQSIEGLPPNIKASYCKYKFYLDKDYVTTNEVKDLNPEFSYEHQHKQRQVTPQFLDFLKNGTLSIEVRGRQRKSLKKSSALTTKELMVREKTFYPGQNVGSDEERKKKKKKKHRREQNDEPVSISVPVPHAEDQNKLVAELKEYKEKMDHLQSYLAEKKRQGLQTVQVSELQAILDGKPPVDEERENLLGKNTSQACSIQ